MVLDSSTAAKRPSRISAGAVVRLAGLALVVGFAIWFVIANRAQLPEVLRAARTARPAYLVLAITLGVSFLVNYAAIHYFTYRAMGLRIPFREMFTLATAGHFLNMLLANTGGFGALPLYYRDADRRHQSRALVTGAYLVVAQLGHLVFAGVLILAMIIAWADGEVTQTEWAASAVFAAYTLGSLALLLAALTSRRTTRFLHGLPARMFRLLRPGRERRATAPGANEADELYETMQLLLHRPGALFVPFVLSIATELIGIPTVWSVLMAFNAHPSAADPIIAYAIGVTFSIVGFLPAGLGFAEAGMGVALTSAGIAGPTVAVTVVTYRAIEVWIPFLAGALATRAAMARRDG